MPIVVKLFHVTESRTFVVSRIRMKKNCDQKRKRIFNRLSLATILNYAYNRILSELKHQYLAAVRRSFRDLSLKKTVLASDSLLLTKELRLRLILEGKVLQCSYSILF